MKLCVLVRLQPDAHATDLKFVGLLTRCHTANPLALHTAAILSGTIWAVAQSSWFVANNNLSFIIAFPLVAMGPGIVGAVWGVFVFREITGTRNYIILVAAFIVSVVAAIVLVYSKVS